MFGALVTGMAGYLRGARWLLARPTLLLLSGLPFLAGLIGFVVGISLFVQYADSWMTSLLMSWFSGWSDQWFWIALYWIVKGLLLASVFVLCVVNAAVLMAVIASPVNEYISVRVERDLLGDDARPVPWRQWPKVIAGEFAKALVVIFVPLILMFIPGVNLFSGVAAAFLIGWDFYDYPLARRGWGFGARLKFVVREFWTILGFGLWLAIPLVQLFLVPLAVAGGTILNVEALARRGLVRLREDSGEGSGVKAPERIPERAPE